MKTKTKLKDNNIFRWIIIPICFALCFFGQLIPAQGGLSSEAIGVLFIFLGTLILWLTIGIDWPITDDMNLIISEKDHKWGSLKDTFKF